MGDAHGGEQIGVVLISVVKEYAIHSEEHLGVFVTNNAETYDVGWKHAPATLRLLHDATASRSLCLGHIINLAAKAFIFGSNVEVFEATVDAVNDLTAMDPKAMKDAQETWPHKGPIGKVHNIFTFIRSSPQRKEALKKTIFNSLLWACWPVSSNQNLSYSRTASGTPARPKPA